MMRRTLMNQYEINVVTIIIMIAEDALSFRQRKETTNLHTKHTFPRAWAAQC